MDNNLQGFDPLSFLGITDFRDEEKVLLRKELRDKISTYIGMRLSELFSEDDLKVAGDDPEKLLAIAKGKIPDFDNKIKKFLVDYKMSFQKNLQEEKYE